MRFVSCVKVAIFIRMVAILIYNGEFAMKQHIFLILAVFLVACGATNAGISPKPSPSEPTTVVQEEVGGENAGMSDNAGMSGNSMSDNSMSDNNMNSRQGDNSAPTLFGGRDSGDGYSRDEAEAIQHLAKHAEMATYLANYENWEGDVWLDDEADVYYIEFYDPIKDEYLGSGAVNAQTGEISDLFIPRELSTDQYQAEQTIVQDIILNDAELLALLDNLEGWEYDTDYDRYEATWYTWFYKGLDEFVVSVSFYDGDPYIDEMYDPSAFDEEEQRRVNQDQAIELAFESDIIYEALDGVDDWKAYASPQENGIYAVSIAGNSTELFYALVDIENWKIIETSK